MKEETTISFTGRNIKKIRVQTHAQNSVKFLVCNIKIVENIDRNIGNCKKREKCDKKLKKNYESA